MNHFQMKKWVEAHFDGCDYGIVKVSGVAEASTAIASLQIPNPKGMTANEFAALCGEYLIDPALALEDEEIVKALKAKDVEEVERLLRENF